MTVIGGLGTVGGPIIGAVILGLSPADLGATSVVGAFRASLGPFFPGLSNVGPPIAFLIIGVILVVIVIFAPKGLISLFQKAYKYFTSESKPKEDKKK